jgi:hypothetical protein
MVAAMMVKSSPKPGPGRHVRRISTGTSGPAWRERRIVLGLTQHQMAELIGVTYPLARTSRMAKYWHAAAASTNPCQIALW